MIIAILESKSGHCNRLAVTAVLSAMYSESLTDALKYCLQQPDQPAEKDTRAAFEVRFAAELKRLEVAGATVSASEAEALLSALGAAQVREWDLAVAFLESAGRRSGTVGPRRPGLALRQRFEFVNSMGAVSSAAR